MGSETFHLLTNVLWRAGSRMLMGMALYKWQIFSAAKTDTLYLTLGGLGLLIGLSLISIVLAQNFSHQFLMEYSMLWCSQLNY